MVNQQAHVFSIKCSGVATLGPTGALAPPSAFVAPPSRPFSLYHVIQVI